jgi:precorrin-6Y C5,15-methyltransferase (decarboxylating)
MRVREDWAGADHPSEETAVEVTTAAETFGIGRSWGLRDEDFEQRRPLRGQITKREVRAVSLYCLGLRPESILWDIGAGTGSISVEAAVICHRGKVYAVERGSESLPLLQNNVARYASENVEIIADTAPQALAALPDPDSVFIGGSGGELPKILDEVASRLQPAGRVVANFATLERTNETNRWFQQRGFQTEINMINAARSKAMPDGSVRLEALNPVFIVTAWREGRSPEDVLNEQRID